MLVHTPSEIYYILGVCMHTLAPQTFFFCFRQLYLLTIYFEIILDLKLQESSVYSLHSLKSVSKENMAQ